MKPSNRGQRIAEQVRRELADLIVRELRDPRIGLVTLNDVEVSPDHAHAKVFFTVIGVPAQQAAQGLNAAAGLSAGASAGQTAAQALNAAAGHLHHALFKRLHIRTVPRLHFIEDTSVERGFRIDRLIDQAVGRGGSD
jgi:ribosome-binding factor A